MPRVLRIVSLIVNLEVSLSLSRLTTTVEWITSMSSNHIIFFMIIINYK